MKDPDIAPMSRADMADEIMLLRAQVKVLQNWANAQNRANKEQGQDDYELARLRESVVTLYNEVEAHKEAYANLHKTIDLRNQKIDFLEKELNWYYRNSGCKSCG